MADKKISELPAATALDIDDLLAVVEDGTTVKATIGDLLDFTSSGEYRLTDYGTVDLTGTVDASTVLDAALTAMYAAGGGTLIFPEGSIKIADQIILPNDGGGVFGSDAQLQPSMIWRGQGAHGSGQNELGSGGTRLICTWDGGGATNDAKFVTRGLGQWAVDDITFQDTTALADTPFLYTTNTTLKINRCAFLGATSDVPVQDALILGGTLKPISTGYDDEDSAFQGYGTVISSCYFNRIRRAVYGRSYCNQVQFAHNFVDKDCGTELAGGAIIEIDGSLDPVTVNEGDYCTNNLIIGNYLQVINYPYGVKIVKGYRNVVSGNGFIDPGDIVAGVRLEGDTVGVTDYPSRDNLVIGNSVSNDVHLSEDTMSTGFNNLVGGGSATEGWRVIGPLRLPTGSAQIRIPVPDGSHNFKITDGTVDHLAITSGTSGLWTIGGPIIMAGNASTPAGSLALTIGNNSRAADSILTFNTASGQQGQIQFKRAGSNSWLIYDANSALLFFRDSVNGVMFQTFNPGSASTGSVEYGVKIRALAAQGVEFGSGGPKHLAGTGTPESVVTAPIGSLFSRSDGGAVTSLYVKESGAGNTGWVAK